MLKEIIIAIQSYNEAHQFIRRHKLWKWILIPGILYTILFMTGMYFFISSANHVIGYLTEVSGASDWIQHQASGWLGFFFATAGMMLMITLLFFYFSLFKYLWLIIGAPVFTYLSEKTETIMEGKEYTTGFWQLLSDARPAMLVALKNAFGQSLYLTGLIFLSLVPFAGMIAPVIALFVEGYYYGFSMLHYSFERKKVPTEKSIQFIIRHKGLAVGNGIVFYLMHIVIIFAPAYAIIAATLSIRDVK